MNSNKIALHQMAIDAWSTAATLFVICAALEAFESGAVSRFFNLLWLLVAALVATVFVMITQPGATETGHRYGAGAGLWLRVGSIVLAAAAWLLLPPSLSLLWRLIASGGILLAALLAWPALRHNE